MKEYACGDMFLLIHIPGERKTATSTVIRRLLLTKRLAMPSMAMVEVVVAFVATDQVAIMRKR